MSSLFFRKVRSAALSDDGSIKVELFQNQEGSICGWFLGPVRFDPSGVAIPYLPRSKSVPASVAVVRAVEEAKRSSVPLCIVDPDDLWDGAWRGR